MTLYSKVFTVSRARPAVGPERLDLARTAAGRCQEPTLFSTLTKPTVRERG